MRICVTIPTRGIVFADTIKSTYNNPEFPSDTIFKMITGYPIPQCHNQCVSEALQTLSTHILFVEDDMFIPSGVITEFIKQAENGERYISIDYGFYQGENGMGKSSVYKDMNTVWWTGLGCTMIERTVFEKDFPSPPFTDEYEIDILNMNPFRYKVMKSTQKEKYGSHDTYFGIQCVEKKINKYIVDGRAIHLRSQNLIRKLENNGLYDITMVA